MGVRSKGVPRVTIQDVARLAGVGVGTVSRVLNGIPNVSEATRQRVVAAVEELGFKPDAMARALRSRRTGTIGAVVPFFTRHFYVEVLRGIARAAASTDSSLIVFDIERREERERVLGGGITGGLVDGLLVVALVPNIVEMEALTANRLTTVLIDAAHAELSGVDVDHAFGAHLAVSHLIQLGHRRIGLIDRPEDPLAAEGFSSRLQGYLRCLGEAELSVDDSLLTTGDYSRQSGYKAMGRLLQLAERPTAVFAASDLQAIGAMEAIRDAGLVVPDDVAVIGYNDIELAEYIGLTTVRLPAAKIGEEGVRLLREAMSGRRTGPERLQFKGRLVVRRTSGGPRATR